jgi:DnaK suppressor protein
MELEEDFSESFLNEIRSLLTRQKIELMEKGKAALDGLRDSDVRGGDSLDQSTAEQGTSTMLRLKDREQKLIFNIEDALERLERGDFGYCIECDEPIAEARLRARPMARLCIDCKEDKERAERQNKVRPGLLDEY